MVLLIDICNSLNAPFWIYIVAVIASIPLILASLGIGKILRLSPLTARLLLGDTSAEKQPRKTDNAKVQES